VIVDMNGMGVAVHPVHPALVLQIVRPLKTTTVVEQHILALTLAVMRKPVLVLVTVITIGKKWHRRKKNARKMMIQKNCSDMISEQFFVSDSELFRYNDSIMFGSISLWCG